MQNPTHTYTAEGTYTVCLTVTADTGATDTRCQTVTVACPFTTAGFQHTLDTCPTAAFSDGSTTSSGTVTSWLWDFGDGNTATTQNPTHTYAANGTYTVCLTATADTGATDMSCDTVPITCVQPAPTATAAFQSDDGDCPELDFTDGSTASQGSITSWLWDFGDANTSTMQNPTHTYTANGTYAVCLTATADTGATDTVCDELVVDCIVAPMVIATFQYDSVECPDIAFSDGSSASPGTIQAWSWDLGDGATSDAQNPNHTYAANGTYTVCLTATDGDGLSDTSCQDVAIDCIADTCGDGTVTGEEACDDGTDNSDTQPDACRTDCTQPRCGDGVIDSGELCDDGITGEPEACTTGCPGPPDAAPDAGSSSDTADAADAVAAGDVPAGDATDASSGGSTDTGCASAPAVPAPLLALALILTALAVRRRRYRLAS